MILLEKQYLGIYTYLYFCMYTQYNSNSLGYGLQSHDKCKKLYFEHILICPYIRNVGKGEGRILQLSTASSSKTHPPGHLQTYSIYRIFLSVGIRMSAILSELPQFYQRLTSTFVKTPKVHGYVSFTYTIWVE